MWLGDEYRVAGLCLSVAIECGVSLPPDLDGYLKDDPTELLENPQVGLHLLQKQSTLFATVIFPLPIIFSLFSRLLLRNTFAA